MARRLVSFWAGGRARKKKAVLEREPVDAAQTAAQQATGAFKKGGKIKVTVKKAKGGMPGAIAGAKHRAAMALAPPNPMEGRLNTGIVGRKPKPAMPTMGAAMGALGPIR